MIVVDAAVCAVSSLGWCGWCLSQSRNMTAMISREYDVSHSSVSQIRHTHLSTANMSDLDSVVYRI